MATHSSILTWKIPWTEEPCGLQCIGSQRVRHDRACTHTHIQPLEVSSAHTHTHTHSAPGGELCCFTLPWPFSAGSLFIMGASLTFWANSWILCFLRKKLINCVSMSFFIWALFQSIHYNSSTCESFAIDFYYFLTQIHFFKTIFIPLSISLSFWN